MSDRLSTTPNDSLEAMLREAAREVSPAAAHDLLDRVEDALRSDLGATSGRWRRGLVAGLALAIAAGGILLALGALGRVEPAPPVTSATNQGALPMWPVQSLEAARDVQRASDAGLGEDMTDPWNVARLFARSVLSGSRWSTTPPEAPGRCTSTGVTATCDQVGRTQARITVVSDRSPATVLYIHLSKLVRTGPGGIWLVTEVRSPDLELPFASGQTVTWRSVHRRVPIGIAPKGLFLHVMSERCNYAQSVAVRNGTISFSVGPRQALDVPENACGRASTALVVAYAMDSERGGGRPVLETALESPVVVFAAVPIRVAPETSSSDNSFEIVWPESSHDLAVRAQERADAGDPEMRWRLDREEVARRAVGDHTFNRAVTEVVDTQSISKFGPIYRVTTEDGEQHEVQLTQPVRQGEDGIWSASYIRSRLQIRAVRIDADGTTLVEGRGAQPNAQVAYSLHRACPPEFGDRCGYTLELRSVRARADGTFRIEDEFGGWMHRSGVLTVSETHDANERSLWGPVTLMWIPPGAYETLPTGGR